MSCPVPFVRWSDRVTANGPGRNRFSRQTIAVTGAARVGIANADRTPHYSGRSFLGTKDVTEDQKLDAIRADIPFLQKGIYVDNASVSPVPTRVRLASERFNAIIAEQLRDARTLWTPVFDRGRALAAKLVGGAPQGVTYVQNTSHGLSLVALGLDWRPGDNLVVCDQEFPSNYLCWVQLEQQGVEVRRISSPDGRLTPDQVRRAMDARTRLVSLSHVQFYSGFRVDVAAVGQLCRDKGSLLVVDGTQSVGAVGIDVGAAGIDVLVASAHKWLMGPRGIGFAVFSTQALAQVTPRMIGWLSVNEPFEFKRTLDFLPDARRFEPGTPNGSGIFGLAERLAQLDDLGMPWIEGRVLDLNQQVCASAARHGLRPVYDFERPSRSGIALLKKEGRGAAELLAALNAHRIHASVRNGAIRVASHYYNTADEMERIVSVLAAA